MTDIDECSWPATIDSSPRNSGLSRNALRYSISGYSYSWTDCQRHMYAGGLLLVWKSPLTFCTPMLAAQVVFGPVPGIKGYAGVLSVASSTSVQLRVPPELPWPACTNQSRPQGVSTLSVAFFTSFCIEIEPSEQVVWLWKSPETYVPRLLLSLS